MVAKLYHRQDFTEFAVMIAQGEFGWYILHFNGESKILIFVVLFITYRDLVGCSFIHF